MDSLRRYGGVRLHGFVTWPLCSQGAVLETGSYLISSAHFSESYTHSPPEKIHFGHVSRIERAFNTLEKVLETRTFLVGERLTLADIHVATVMLRAANWYLDKTNIAKYTSVVRFVETILNQPQISEFWTIQWPEKVATYTPPAKDTKKKEDKPKAAPSEKPKKEEKPKAKPKEPEPEEEEDDLVPKEEPKAKNPLDFLPKSTFNLEDWKRAYSNKDTKGPGGSIEWFYEKSAESVLDVGEGADRSSASTRKGSPCGDVISSTTKN